MNHPTIVLLTILALPAAAGATATQESWATKFTASDAPSGRSFGRTVTTSAGSILVGTQPSASAYLYRPDGGAGWTETKVSAPENARLGLYGESLATDGDSIVVGAPESGKAFVLRPNGEGGWTETDITPRSGSGIGISVGISGDRILVGSFNEAFLVWPDGEGGWRSSELPDIGTDLYGWAVAVEGEVLVIGDPWSEGSVFRHDLSADSDGDCWRNLTEIEGRSHPADAASVPTPNGPITLPVSLDVCGRLGVGF